MNRLFNTAPISLLAWAEIMAVAVLCSLIVALEKIWSRRTGST